MDVFYVKGAQAWDIRRQVFYLIQAGMGSWLKKYTKNLILYWFGPDIRHFVLRNLPQEPPNHSGEGKSDLYSAQALVLAAKPVLH